MDNPRIEDLKRRIQKDPASIAFAQLGEELRRAGRSREAIETCRAGLKRHPGYLSARVTLGRALLEVGQAEEAEHELKEVLRLAPENLAALRGLAEALHRRGDLASALAYYEIAVALAPRDPDLQQTVAALRGELQRASPSTPEPRPAPSVAPSRAVDASPPVEAQAALPALERWLSLIVADRDERQAAHGPEHPPV